MSVVSVEGSGMVGVSIRSLHTFTMIIQQAADAKIAIEEVFHKGIKQVVSIVYCL